MKKGGLFSPTLYREGLRQTRALGWVLAGIIFGSLLMGFVMRFGMALTAPALSPGASFVDLYEGVPMLLLLFVWTPIMILVLFHFITKRNQCDFYHALPHTRLQLAGSFLAAILTWTFGSLLLAFGLFSALYACLPHTLAVVNWTGALHSLLSSVAMLMLVTGASFLAVSLTGTVSSGLLGTGLILFMPRILLGIITVQAVNTVPILSVGDLPFPLGSYNLLANFFSDIQAGFLHAPAGAILYTFLLGVLYLALGLWAFSRRKSERAGSAAISRSAQALFRVLIASPILLGAAVLLVNTFIINRGDTNEFSQALAFGAASSAVMLLAMSLGIFVLYELFTTRTGRRLLRILPSFGLVIAIAVVGGLAVVCAKPMIASSVPKRDDIESVSLLKRPSQGLLEELFSDDYSGSSYFNSLSRNIPIQDPNVCATVALAMQNVVNARSDGEDYDVYSDSYYGSPVRLDIRLRNGRHQIRTLCLSDDQMNMIYSELCRNETYVRAMTHLPDESRTNLIVYAPDQSITAEQARRVYASLRQEIAEGDPLTWIRLVDQANFIPTSLQMQTVIGSDVVSASLPVTADYPKTLELYINFARENADFENWLKKFPLKAAEIEDGTADIQISSFDETFNTWFSSADLDPEDAAITGAWDETVEWLREQAKKPIDVNARYGRVSISTWRYNGASSSITLFIPMETVPDALGTLSAAGRQMDDSDETSDETSDPAASESSAPANGDATTAPTTAAPTTTAPTTAAPTTTAPTTAAPTTTAPATTAPTTTAPEDGTESSRDAWTLPAVPI